MTKGRLEAFSDGVIAIILTIMVLELKRPEEATLAALQPLMPVFAAYVLSFLHVGIYWNNHHHLVHTVSGVNGRILWANLHLLFWLSLLPFATAWLGDHPTATMPAVIYGVLLLLSGSAYAVLQRTIIAHQGPGSVLREAVGRDLKTPASVGLYLAGVLLAFVHPWIADGCYAVVALLWLVPDSRIERRLTAPTPTE